MCTRVYVLCRLALESPVTLWCRRRRRRRREKLGLSGARSYWAAAEVENGYKKTYCIILINLS